MYSATRVYPIGIRTILDMYDRPVGTSEMARQLMSGRAAAGCGCRVRSNVNVAPVPEPEWCINNWEWVPRIYRPAAAEAPTSALA